MSDPLVSIIVPAYNSGKYLNTTIQSVLNQTYSCWELLIIDDGSTDDTASVLKKYTESDSRIRSFYQDNRGQADARNLGISMSNGSILAFLDSDDVWFPEKLEISVKEFLSEEQDLLFTNSYIFYDDDELKDISALQKMDVGRKYYEGEEAISDFLCRNRIPTLTVLVKKEVIAQAGGFKGKMIEDYYLWMTLLLSGCTFRSIDNLLSAYRIHDQAITSKDKYASKHVLLMLKSLREEYPILIDSYSLQIKSWIIKYIRKGLTVEDLSFAKEIIVYFGFYKKSIAAVLCCKHILPFSVIKRFLRMII